MFQVLLEGMEIKLGRSANESERQYIASQQRAAIEAIEARKGAKKPVSDAERFCSELLALAASQ